MNRITCVVDGLRGNTRIKNALVRSLNRSLKLLKIRHSEITLLVTNKKRMKQLNAQFRGEHKATDVLSFAMRETHPFPNIPKNNEEYLGHIVLNMDDVRKQADAFRTTQIKIAQFLATHGLLHLLGYDHAKMRGLNRMRKIERLLCTGNVFYQT